MTADMIDIPHGMTRRRFFQAGAAGVVVLAVPLPAGMPVEASAIETLTITIQSADIQSADRVYQYTLLEPFDWTTAFYDDELQAVPYPHDCLEGLPSIAFNSEGTKMYVTGAVYCEE